MADVRSTELRLSANPRKWTTKVNIAVVVAVLVVFLVGAGYVLYAWLNPREVQEQIDRGVEAPAAQP